MVTAYHFESGCPGSNPEWGLIYYEALITAQGLPELSSLQGSTLGTSAAEHKGCNWGMQVDWWLQPCAVFDHSFSGISWHMPQKCRNEVNSIAWLYRRAQPKDSIFYIHIFTYIYNEINHPTIIIELQSFNNENYYHLLCLVGQELLGKFQNLRKYIFNAIFIPWWLCTPLWLYIYIPLMVIFTYTWLDLPVPSWL